MPREEKFGEDIESSGRGKREITIGPPPYEPLCPHCGTPSEVIEGKVDPSFTKWLYCYANCPSCDLDFHIGEVTEKCSCCEVPFPSDPYYDVNSYDSHKCGADGRYYCTPCLMARFLDGCIDLSMDDPSVDSGDIKWEIVTMWCTFIGGSISPYISRLKQRGFKHVADMKESEFDVVRRTCGNIARAGGKYLVLIEYDYCANSDLTYMVYETDKENAIGFPERG